MGLSNKLRGQIKRVLVSIPLTKNFHRQVKRIMMYLPILRWIREFKMQQPKEQTENILICAVVTDFWVMDMVFYSLHLKARGNDVTLLINKSVIGKNIFLLQILRKLRAVINIQFYNANLKTNNTNNFNLEEAKKATINNICYKENIEYYDQIIEDFKPIYDNFLNEYKSTYEISDKLLASKTFQKVIVPSGFVYESAPIYNYCRNNDINVITVETYGFKTAKRMLGYNELAVRDFSNLSNLKISNEIEEYIGDHVKFQENPIAELEKKTGFLAYQTAASECIPENIKEIIDNGKPNILIPTTVTGDSSTIGVYSPFGKQSNWIKKVVSFLSEIECNVFVRIHPIEKLIKPQFQLDKFLNSHINEMGIKNVFIIKPEDSFNTYTLTKHIKFVLTWVSTISADFVLRDKPVLLAAQSPFYSLGFCYYEKSTDKYFERLNYLLNNNFESFTNPQKDLAKLYIYFLFKYRVYTIDPAPGEKIYNNYSLIQENFDITRLLDSMITYS